MMVQTVKLTTHSTMTENYNQNGISPPDQTYSLVGFFFSVAAR